MEVELPLHCLYCFHCPMPILFSLFMDDEGSYAFMFIRYGYRYRIMCF